MCLYQSSVMALLKTDLIDQQYCQISGYNTHILPDKILAFIASQDENVLARYRQRVKNNTWLVIL